MVPNVRPAPQAHQRRRYLLELAAVVVSLGLALAAMSAHDAVNAGAGPKLFLLLRMAGLVLLCTWLLRRDGERWMDVGLRRPRRWWIVPLAMVGGFAAVLVATGIVLPALGVPAYVSTRPSTSGDLAEYLYWAIPVSWGSAAFGEELVLRGFVLDRIQKAIGTPGLAATLTAIVLQATIFGAFHVHQGVAGVVLTGTIGLVLGLVWLAGGRNLWACILIHGLINLISQTEYYTAGSGR